MQTARCPEPPDLAATYLNKFIWIAVDSVVTARAGTKSHDLIRSKYRRRLLASTFMFEPVLMDREGSE
ncbi:hypothetical protein [Burkholderia diffusa]|uniref:hypothetical protein n=1 Tax=Burkholderia diffusa TaxID=488732 RepID=UPI0012D922C1|nr:hypothetical protein [Burkholderia diffusa]